MDNIEVSVVTPMYNETALLERNAKVLCEHVRGLGKTCELLLVDNGSTDDSLEKARKLARGYEGVRVFSIPQKSLGDALRVGFQNARGEYVIWFPIDLAIDLKFIEESLESIKSCDFVVGSKDHPKSVVDKPKIRFIFSKVYKTLVNALFRLGIGDTQCVKTMRRSSLNAVLGKTRAGGIVFEVELLYRAKKAGLRLLEFPVVVLDKRKDSKIKVFDMVKAVLQLFWLRVKISCA